MPEPIPTCDDCASLLPGWTAALPRYLQQETPDTVKHIACGIDHGGWCCEHVDWTWEDAAGAYALLHTMAMRDRDRARAEIERLTGALRASDRLLHDFVVAAIACSPALDIPFTDRPDLSAWKRTWRPLGDRANARRDANRGLLADEAQMEKPDA